MFLNIIRLLRPQQWMKNLFVFLPVFFGGRMGDLHALFTSLIAFFAFSFVSSAVYCINDVIDAPVDRLHEKKRQRPVASGAVSSPLAILISILLICCTSLLLIFIFNTETCEKAFLILGIYLVLNISYCLQLKKYPLIDVFIIAFGFVLRVILGGVTTNIWVSPWLVLMTFMLALFLAVAKRRDDVIIMEKTGTVMRRSIIMYSSSYLNLCLAIVGTINILCYIIYTMQPEVITRFQSEYVYATSIFVLLAILRYLQLTVVHEQTDSPTKVLLKDRFLQLCILAWGVAFAIIIYI